MSSQGRRAASEHRLHSASSIGPAVKTVLSSLEHKEKALHWPLLTARACI